MSSYRQWEWSGDQPEQVPQLYVAAPPTWYQRVFKPAVDMAAGLILSIVLAPIMLLAILLILIVLGRPVIYRQERVGLGGRTFQLYKLRTMLPDRRAGDSSEFQGPERRQTHKSRSDPRIVPLGAFLRSFRIDEVPQLLNVVRGDMSLVGPRPELPHVVAQYEGWQHHRHTVKPGLTGLWQIEGPTDKLMHECTEMDLEYISKISLRTDLSILFRTPGAMLRRHGF